MNASKSPEDLLRATLRAKAEDAHEALTFDDVRRDAVRRLHTGRRATILAAAAVVVAVAAPTALLLRPAGDSPAPSPSPSTSTTLPEPTPTESAPTTTEPPAPVGTGFEGITRGRDIAIPWLGSGAIHVRGGADVPAPAGSWEAFASYHGGWLLSGTGGLVQLDGTGRSTLVAPTASRIAISADGTQTAFLADGGVHVGITSGMGDGETVIPVQGPDEAGPVGFLSSGRVVYNGLKGEVLVLDDRPGSAPPLVGLARATSSTESGDLVAGTTVDDDGTAAVVSATTGRTLWTKAHWMLGSFSPNGRFLSAYRSATGGEFETVAILDASTGEVVATAATSGIRALPAVPPTAWEDDADLLIPYRSGSSWAVLRLTLAGHLTRASDVVESPAGSLPFVLSARP